MLLNAYIGEGTSWQCKNSRIRNLNLPCAVKLYTHVHHGDRNLYFIWKLPSKNNRTEQQKDQVINQVRDKFPFYSSRATRAHFASLLIGRDCRSEVVERVLFGYVFRQPHTTELSGTP